MNNCVYQESLSIKVGRFLLSKGFDIASCTGFATSSLVETSSLGILYNNPNAKTRKYLFGLIKRKTRRIFLGVIWFNSRGANDKNWFFEVYGRNHMYTYSVIRLVEEMSLVFNVKITVRLVQEQLDFENYLSDCGD